MSDVEWMVAFLLVSIITALPFVVRKLRSRRATDYAEVIHPIVAYIYLGVALRGLWLCIGLGQSIYVDVGDVNSELTIFEVFAVACVGLTAMYAGYFGAKMSRIATRVSRLAIFQPMSSVRVNIILFICLIYCVLALWASYHLQSTYGGGLAVGESPNTFVKRTAQGGLYPVTGLWRLGFIAAMIAAAELLSRRSKRLFPFIVLMTAVIASASAVIVTGNKSMVYFSMLGIAIIYNYCNKRLRGIKVIAIIVVCTIIYPVLNAYRHGGIQALEEGRESIESEKSILERSHHFDMMYVIINKLRGGTELQLGRSLTELVYFYVPRAWWSNKPMSFGYRFGVELLPEYGYVMGSSGGETPSIMGELLLNAHVPGVIIGMFLFGALLNRFYATLINGYMSPVKVATYAIFVIDALQVVEGPIASHCATFIVDAAAILPMCLALKLRAVRKPVAWGTWGHVRGRRRWPAVLDMAGDSHRNS